MTVLRVGGFFTGIGAHHSALERLRERHEGFGYEVVFQCEIDGQTAEAYDAIHGTTPNLGDITKVADLGGDLRVDVLMCSPPCQDISVAGTRKGLGEGTRSGLIYEIPRIIRATEERERPRIIVWEDVPALVSKTFLPHWEEITSDLATMGYRTVWKVLNAADYGVAQSRRRMFAVSVLGAEPPPMPEPVPLQKRLRDYLEPEPVAASYYLSEERLEGLVWSTQKEKEADRGFAFKPWPEDADCIAHTISTRGGDGRRTTSSSVTHRAKERTEGLVRIERRCEAGDGGLRAEGERVGVPLQDLLGGRRIADHPDVLRGGGTQPLIMIGGMEHDGRGGMEHKARPADMVEDAQARLRGRDDLPVHLRRPGRDGQGNQDHIGG